MEILDELLRANISENNDILLELLNSFEEHQTFVYTKQSSERNFLAFIQEQLNNSKSRIKGIIILSKFVKQCSQEVFINNVNIWISSIFKYIETNKKCIESIAFTVLELIIKKCSRIQELTKILNNLNIWKLVDVIKSIPHEQFPIEALKCIETMLLYYGPQCTSHKENLEKLLYNFVDLNNLHINRINAAANCIALLPLAASRNEATNQDHWTKEQFRFATSIHEILDKLLDGILEIHQYPRPGSTQPLPILILTSRQKESFLKRIQQITNRLNNLLLFFTQFISKNCLKHKQFQLEIIFGIISRILNVTPETLGTSSNEKLVLATFLPSIHQNTFELLYKVIYMFGCGMLDFKNDICQNFINVLLWTGSKDYIRLTYSSLRFFVYETLKLYLNVNGSVSFDTNFQEQLVSYLLADIYIPKQSMKISARNLTIKKHLTKKERKQRKQILNGESEQIIDEELHRDKLIDPNDYENICISALNTLQTLLSNRTICLQLIKKIHVRVFRLAFDVLNSKSSDLPFPYILPSCRKALYHLVQACSSISYPSWPAPISTGIQLLTNARNDSSMEVSTCVESLLENLSLIIHPSGPGLENLSSLNQSTIYDKEESQDEAADDDDDDDEDEEEQEHISKNTNDEIKSQTNNLSNQINGDSHETEMEIDENIIIADEINIESGEKNENQTDEEIKYIEESSPKRFKKCINISPDKSIDEKNHVKFEEEIITLDNEKAQTSKDCEIINLDSDKSKSPIQAANIDKGQEQSLKSQTNNQNESNDIDEAISTFVDFIID